MAQKKFKVIWYGKYVTLWLYGWGVILLEKADSEDII